jgi:hypothetical protein
VCIFKEFIGKKLQFLLKFLFLRESGREEMRPKRGRLREKITNDGLILIMRPHWHPPFVTSVINICLAT